VKVLLLILKNLKLIAVLTAILFILIQLESNLLGSSETIVINEILYDPNESDLGYEWIELYNKLDIEINLSNWKIQIAGTTFKDSVILSDVLLKPHSYFLICEQKVPQCDYYVPKLSLQNGGDATDGVQILDAKLNVIDSVFYDKPNINNLTNETGKKVLDEETADTTETNESLGRKNFIDTDISYDDFYIFSSPTPGKENP